MFVQVESCKRACGAQLDKIDLAKIVLGNKGSAIRQIEFLNEAHHKDSVEAFDIDASVQTKMVSKKNSLFISYLFLPCGLTLHGICRHITKWRRLDLDF